MMLPFRMAGPRTKRVVELISGNRTLLCEASLPLGVLGTLASVGSACPAAADGEHDGGLAGGGGWPGAGGVYGGAVHKTGRKNSCAVCPTIWIARCWSLTPGSWMMMLPPWRAMLGSATPRASTRLRMIEMAWSSWSWGTWWAVL